MELYCAQYLKLFAYQQILPAYGFYKELNIRTTCPSLVLWGSRQNWLFVNKAKQFCLQFFVTSCCFVFLSLSPFTFTFLLFSFHFHFLVILGFGSLYCRFSHSHSYIHMVLYTLLNHQAGQIWVAPFHLIIYAGTLSPYVHSFCNLSECSILTKYISHTTFKSFNFTIMFLSAVTPQYWAFSL